VSDQPPATIEVLIKNRKGLHARASAKFVRCAELFDAEVRVLKDGHVVDATSIMGLMMLGASTGSKLRLEGSGKDAAAALAALTALIDDLFGEGE
jgi:phosphocarrier protein HPr